MTRSLVLALALCTATAYAAQDPETVFNKTCAMCHNGQLPAAPARGDHAAWQPRLDQGMPVLLKHATEGLNVMPPKGMCMDCSDEDLAAVITWMSR